jgi:DNA-binding MarR family transcriptional regulator
MENENLYLFEVSENSRTEKLSAMIYSTMSPTHKSVLGRLIGLRPCEFVLVTDLALQLNLSPNTISKSIKWLKGNGIISVRKHKSTTTQWFYNTYDVLEPRFWRNVTYHGC